MAATKQVSPEDRQRRQELVADMLLSGARPQQIIRQTGHARQTIYNDIKAVREQWRHDWREAIESAAAEDFAKLALLERPLWKLAMDGKWLAIDRLLAIIKRRAEMIGYDAPMKAVVTHVTVEVALEALKHEQQQVAELIETARARGVELPPIPELLSIEAVSVDTTA